MQELWVDILQNHKSENRVNFKVSNQLISRHLLQTEAEDKISQHQSLQSEAAWINSHCKEKPIIRISYNTMRNSFALLLLRTEN